MITAYEKIFGHASKHRVQYGIGTVQYQQQSYGTGYVPVPVLWICNGGFIANPDPAFLGKTYFWRIRMDPYPEIRWQKIVKFC
jgi:hypothetical protein